MRVLVLLFSITAAGLAQGTEPKPRVEDYDVHSRSNNVSVGAEYMVHSFSGQGQTFIVNDYLVVEVALYPPKGEAVSVKPGAFGLRINGKSPIVPQAPAMVSANMQRPEWQQRPHLEAGGGLGNTGVILGRPVPSTSAGRPDAARPPAATRAGSRSPRRYRSPGPGPGGRTAAADFSS